MSAPLLMVAATFLFATMSVCVKLASALYTTGEIVLYRGLVGVLMIALLARRQGLSLRTTVPGMHAWRSIVGVSALSLWFWSIGQLPLATAITLNYMSSVWMALFLIGGAVVAGAQRVDPRLVMSVLVGFGGVALVLQPTLDKDQLWPGVVGLGSGMLAALAYLQVTTLGRVGEPELRVVFYFSIGSALAGVCMARRRPAAGHRPAGHHGPDPDDPRLCHRQGLVQRQPAVPGHRVLDRLRRAAVRRCAQARQPGRHGPDHRRRPGRHVPAHAHAARGRAGLPPAAHGDLTPCPSLPPPR